MTVPRVRIAPSPSGNLHIGTARTALFNYLFTKRYGGKFILRIEDTDLERSNDNYTQNIYDSLKALGLEWDEGPDVGGSYGPYVQSQRLDIYKQRADILLEKGLAYECYCTQEELEQEKEILKEQKKPLIYSQKCRNLSEEQKQAYIAEGRKAVIRFKVDPEEVIVDDIVRGNLPFDTSLIGDFVIIKSNGIPTYNFAVVIDDIDMQISHVIRGEDHISNTPKQILVYKAYGKTVPKFAHVGMILAPDKSKLSKRFGATAVSEYVKKGYLPEALVNFLALLGWSLPEGEEIKSLDEIIKVFDIERVSHSGAVFDTDKLNWINGCYIRSLELNDIVNRCKIYLADYDLNDYSAEKLQVIVSAFRERLTTLQDIKEAVEPIFVKEIVVSNELKETVLADENAKTVLQKFCVVLDSFDYSNLETLATEFKNFTKSLKPIKMKFIMMPIRVSITGKQHGADLSSYIYLMGKDLIQKRVNEVIKTL